MGVQLAGAEGAQLSIPLSPREDGGHQTGVLSPVREVFLLKVTVTYGNRWGETLGKRPHNDRVDGTALPGLR